MADVDTTAVGSLDNLVYPTLIGDRLNRHTVVMFVALIGGLALFGPVGLILGPLSVSVTRSLLEAWHD